MQNQIIESQPQAITSTTDMVMNHQAMAQMHSLAELMAGGTATVPKHLQGSPADCMAIVMQAAQWKMNPFAVAQKTHIVSGTLGYEAQLVNAVISSSNAIIGRFKYQYGGNWPQGQDAYVQVGAILAGETEITWGEPLYPALVTTKNSPLWKTAPKQQAAYLAVKYWARLYAPDVILGVYSSDELQTIESPAQEVVINPEVNASSATKSSTLNSILQTKQNADDEPSDAYDVNSRAIQKCTSLDELTEIGGDIAVAVESSKLLENEKQLLTAEYQRRKRALSPMEQSTGEIKV